MGGHYGAIHVRTVDANVIRIALEELSRASKAKFLLGPLIDGWVAVFPNENGQDFGVSEALAKKIHAPLLHTLVHDDDVFAYRFHEGGKLVDSYNSCPDYFGGDPEPRGGNVDLLQTVLPDAGRRDELRCLLEADRFDFEVKRLEKFSELLNLPNAVGAYEYLQDGEREGIKQWKQFIHIPDLTAERAGKRAAKVEAKAEMKQMIKDGLLVLEIEGQKTSHPLFHTSPVWCVDPNTSEVLLAWAGSPIGTAAPMRVSRINTQTGGATTTDVEFSSHVHCMAVNSTGSWIAAGCACGDWKTQIWDLRSGKLVAEILQSRAVARVGFSQDGQSLFSLSEKTITIVDPLRPDSIKTILLPHAAQTMVLHPAGEHIVAESQGMLMLVYLPTGAVLKSLWIPMPSGPERELLNYAESQGMGQRFLSNIEGHVSREEMEDARIRMERHFLPKQNIFSLGFGALGNYLFCGTTAGLCVLAWDKILAATDKGSIDPIAFVPAEQRVREGGVQGSQLIYAVPADSAGKRILFAGLEGKAKFVNFADGRIGDLLSPPVKRPFRQLELTPDRRSLVGTAIPKPEAKGNKREPSCFQIWNYKALCAAAGLNW